MVDDSRVSASGGVLLVGSVPLRSAGEVFQVMATELGDRLRQLPDGETGPRSDWIVWQYPVLSSRPEFEICPPGDQPHRALPRLRISDGESLDTLRFDDLGYAEAALSSYRSFARRKRDGQVPAVSIAQLVEELDYIESTEPADTQREPDPQRVVWEPSR